MSERIIVHCAGLFIKRKSGTYSQVNRLEFLPKDLEEKSETKTLNPIMVEDCIPKSFPAEEALKVFEDSLPNSLFEFDECMILFEQPDSKIFGYKGKKYIILDKKLYQIIGKESN